MHQTKSDLDCMMHAGHTQGSAGDLELHSHDLELEPLLQYTRALDRSVAQAQQ